jgi:hydrogenase maturation protein HypF
MITDPQDALRLGADWYLLHNQEIVNRADDSVLRMCGDSVFYLRKSRGAIPSYYETGLKGDAAAVGAQENLAGAVARNGRIYPTQYVGNGEKVGVEEYLEEAIRRQMDFTGCEPSAVAMDMHPAYGNRAFAKLLAKECGAQLFEVQHHHAHAVSLMVDAGIDDGLTVLALDGTGHGDDGASWGGEVMSCTMQSYERLAHLQYLPLIGGQKAVTDIRRLRLAIDMANGVESDTGFSDSELAVLTKLANKSVKSSSFGRFLDTIAYSLGVCKTRTYDGEPAMKLERLLAHGKLIDGFKTETVNGEIMTAPLFANLGKASPADEAYSAVHAVLAEMVESAAEAAESRGEKRIGITGGVSYDVPIVRMAEELAHARGMELVIHSRVPNGDGGISTGQAASVLSRL